MFELSWSKACGCVAPCPNPSLTMELRSELMLYPYDAQDNSEGDQLTMVPRLERCCMRMGRLKKERKKERKKKQFADTSSHGWY